MHIQKKKESKEKDMTEPPKASSWTFRRSLQTQEQVGVQVSAPQRTRSGGHHYYLQHRQEGSERHGR